MLLLKRLLLCSIILLSGCQISNPTKMAVDFHSNNVVGEDYITLPNAVNVLREISESVSLSASEVICIQVMLDTLDLTNIFPGIYNVSRTFTEQIIYTLIYEEHNVTHLYVTDLFIYIHFEYMNYEYMMWWTANQLLIAGDFPIIREVFLR